MQHKNQIIVLSIFFFILVSAEASYDSIIAYMFDKLKMPDVGAYSLAVLYLSFAASLVLTPYLRLSIKTQLLLAGPIFLLNYALGLIASLCDCQNTIYFLVSAGTALGGIGNGLIWINQGRYIHLVCELFNENEDRGKMFSLFGLFYCASLLLGAVVTLVGMGLFSTTIYFAILVVLTIIAEIFCVFFLKDVTTIGEEQLQRIAQEGGETAEEDRGRVQLVMAKAGRQVESEQYHLGEFLRKFIGFIPYMGCLVPMFMTQAIGLGVQTNIYFKLIPSWVSDEDRDKYAGLIKITGGVSAIIGITCCGFIFDWLGTKVAGRVVIVMYFLFCWFFVVALQLETIAVVFVMPFLWTFMMRFQFGLFPVVVSKHYDGRTEGFSVIKLIPALFNVLYQVLMIVTKNNITLLMFAAFSALAFPALYFFNRVDTAYQPLEDKDQAE